VHTNGWKQLRAFTDGAKQDRGAQDSRGKEINLLVRKTTKKRE
jgi:hypothetical protein